MPTLNWIGKDAAVSPHKQAPFRLLEPMPALSRLIAQGVPQPQTQTVH